MTNSHRTSSASNRSSDRASRRRRATIGAAVGIAAAAASVPVFADLSPSVAAPRSGSAALTAALAGQMDAAAPSSGAAALAQGTEQLNAKQYEEALATLQSAKADDLDAAGKAKLESSLATASEAAAQRKAARASFEQGQTSLAAGDRWAAIGQFAAAKDNQYADAATVEKANTQVTLAVSELGDLNAVYDGAKSDYEAGKLDVAKAKFVALNAVGFKAGAGNKSPADYVALASEKQSSTPAIAGAAAEATAAADTMTLSAAPAVDSKKAARQAYVSGRTAYARGDIAGAKEAFQKAAELNYKKGFGEAGPDKMLAEIAKKEQADVARAAKAGRDNDGLAAAAVVAPVAAAEPSAVAPMVATASPDTAVAQASPAPEPATVAPSNGTAAAQASTPEPVAQTPAAPTSPATGDAVQAAPAPISEPMAQATTPAGGLREAAAADRIRAEQNAFRAKQFVDQADQAKAGQRYNEALSLYDEALKYDPNNATAQSGKADTLKLTGQTVPQGDTFKTYENVVTAKQQNIRFSVQAALEESQMARKDGDYAGSRRAIIKAQSARDSDTGIFKQEEINGFDSAIRSETGATDRAEAEFIARSHAEDQQKAIEEQNIVQRNTDIQRQRTIAALVKQSRQLTGEGRNKDAMKVIDQILSIEPANDYALGVKPLIYDKIQIRNQRDTMEKVNRNLTEVLNMAEESRVPIADLLTYPTDWPDLAARRDETTQRERGGATDATTEAILGRTLPSLPFDNVPFTDVVDYLRDTTQANIFVNWTAIEGAGVDKNQPITVRLTNVKFSKVLEIILDSAGGGVTRLGYTIDDGVITISTQEDLAKNVATRTYDIRDLLVRIPDFPVPSVSISGGGSGSSSSLFTGSGGNNGSENQVDREQLVEQITQLITDTIASDSWKANGGLIGAIQELGGQLIVTQTPENQTSIARLLEQLRETRAIQVNVEARFLSVQRNFLEEIGVDFDFQFNVDYDNALDPNGANVTPGSQFSPVTVRQNSVSAGTGGFTGPASLVTGVSTNLGPEAAAGNYGLQTGVSAFLDDFRASLFLRAVQLGQNATTLTAPRLTLFNGQQAYVQVQTQQYYVSDLNPVVGTGSVGYDPTVEPVFSGVSLGVQATVSADRKYVTLTVQPTLQRLVALRTFTFSTGDIDTGNGNNNGGVSTSIQNQLQLPEFEVTQLATTVSVPDRGTLLLGGQTLMGEVERESGTPILSKIPFLKRLFTNRGTAKDEQVLLILIKPTIIIQREVEANSFPLLEAQ